MLDINYIRENRELIEKAAKEKNFPVNLTNLLKLDSEIGPLQARTEYLLAKKNRLSKEVRGSSEQSKEKIRVEVLELKKEIDSNKHLLKSKKEELNNIMLTIPQPATADVPVGKDDKDNVEIRKVGSPAKKNFKLKNHIDIGKNLGILDLERAAKLSGSRSYLLLGAGAQLEQALLRYVYDKVISKSYLPIAVPVLVKHEAMEGTGYFPVGRDQAYCVEKDNMALIGTSEVALCSLHANEILQEDQLPLRYMAMSSCFRREAGTYGRDTKGLYRVHQFQKIEMLILSQNDKKINDSLHEELLSIAEEILKDLDLAYRCVYVCTGDLGQGQVKKHDLETWMPSRKSYGETHSCSSFYEFQSRRLKIRYKNKAGRNKFVYTLNNTALASPRIILSILENYQNEDGSVTIPTCLRKHMNNQTKISL